MKKNLITMLTLVLVLVNLVLTIILTISILPETKKVNTLITKICAAIDLDLESGTVSGSSVSIDLIELYEIEDTMTINLKSDDGNSHYAVLAITLSLDSSASDYDTIADQLSSKETLVKSKINDIISSYTLDEIRNDTAGVQKEILTALQQLFGTSTIIAVNFSSAQYQ